MGVPVTPILTNKIDMRIKTTKGYLTYERDFERDGIVVMKNPKTINEYVSLRYKTFPDAKKNGVFFAFSKEQFNDGVNELKSIGKLKEGERVVAGPYGLFGKDECIDSFLKEYDLIDDKIRERCDPQEVYFYEYNNHECMYDYDGDSLAWNAVVSIFGKNIKIKRLC